MRILFLLLTSLFSTSLLTQSHKDNDRQNLEYRSLLSAGIGIDFQNKYDEWNSSLNYNIELTPHLGKGYFLGIGINHHEIPVNEHNKATYLYTYFSKSLLLLKKLVMQPGLGLTLGVTSQGHPGCCVAAIYGMFNVVYEIVNKFGIGMNMQLFTDFSETGMNIVPGIRLSYIP